MKLLYYFSGEIIIHPKFYVYFEKNWRYKIP